MEQAVLQKRTRKGELQRKVSQRKRRRRRRKGYYTSTGKGNYKGKIPKKAEKEKDTVKEKAQVWKGKGKGKKGNYQGMMPMDIGAIEGDEQLIQWEPDQEDVHGAYENW